MPPSWRGKQPQQLYPLRPAGGRVGAGRSAAEVLAKTVSIPRKVFLVSVKICRVGQGTKRLGTRTEREAVHNERAVFM